MGGSIAVSAAEVANEIRPGLRVRPPPSLLRGLQAPPGSLSPLGGAALRLDVRAVLIDATRIRRFV